MGLAKHNKLYQPNGCDECGNTGYKGRIAINELLIVDDQIRKLIIKHEDSNIIKQEAVKKGMKTLWQNGIEKVAKGITTLNELERVVDIDENNTT